jgi:phospholipase C
MAQPRRQGSLEDVEHVVILMQENRSFDHYYGTMRGVRGYSDRAAIALPSGRKVFFQADPSRSDGGYLLPFHVDTRKVNGEELGDTDHSWGTTHAAADGGLWDDWVPAKTETTMAHFNQADIPFQRALAGAYTICDNYFCSIQGPTTPNRLYLWTGTIDPDGKQGGPATFNPDDYNPVYSWTTYPERLQTAGVSWQVYANHEVGDEGGDAGWVGDYGDNPLWLFDAYHQALASPDPKVRQLADRAAVISEWLPNSGLGHDVDHVLQQFIADCRAGRLPEVSWIVAPYQWCEHPTARPADGAVYQERVIQALWQNRQLWESTVLFINYDENDGLFDHVLPPQAAPGTPGERLSLTGTVPVAGEPTAPIGLGPRVPMTVISPWSRGGWVNSQVHDHTSVIRFLEAWTGVREPNISAWRRPICGDLTGCFDFSRASFSSPALPSAKAFQAFIDDLDDNLPEPAPPPVGQQQTPAQEPGTARARPLPYQPLANISVSEAASPSAGVTLTMENDGTADLQLSVRAAHLASPPQFIDIQAKGSATTTLPLASGDYDVRVHGPNGFVRSFRGDAQTTAAGVEATVTLTRRAFHPLLLLTIVNGGRAPVSALVGEAGDGPGGGKQRRLTVSPGRDAVVTLDPLATSDGWYDLTVRLEDQQEFRRHFAGHLEDGRASVTG